MNLNKLASVVHAANIKWWQDINTGKPIARNPYELLALAISEVSECLEGERKGLMDDKLPHRKMAEVEMADTKIRLLDFAAGFGYNLQKYNLMDQIPENKGEALHSLMSYIIHIANSNTPAWICLSLAFIEAYCKKHGYDLQGAFDEKIAFNAQREDHKHEARRIAGGKQF
jgi:hypothetical protein